MLLQIFKLLPRFSSFILIKHIIFVIIIILAFVPFHTFSQPLCKRKSSSRLKVMGLVNHCNSIWSLTIFLFQTWEAPWLRTNRRDVRSTGYNRVPAFQFPTNNRRKQDVASLIEERLKQNDAGTFSGGQSDNPGLPVLSKAAPKGETIGK